MSTDKRVPVVTPKRRDTYTHIKNMAVNCVFHPGQQIVINDLAAQLGVSATPVRESLSKLSSEGLINLVHNKGFFARILSPIEMTDLHGIASVVLQHSVAHRVSAVDRVDVEPFIRYLSVSITTSSDEDAAHAMTGDLEAAYLRIAAMSGSLEIVKIVVGFIDRTHHLRHCWIGEDRLKNNCGAFSASADDLAAQNSPALLLAIRAHFEDQRVHTDRLVKDINVEALQRSIGIYSFTTRCPVSQVA